MKSIREMIIEVTDEAKRKHTKKALVNLLEKMRLQEESFMSMIDDDSVACPTWLLAVKFVEEAIEEVDK